MHCKPPSSYMPPKDMGAFTCKVMKKVNPIIAKHYKFYFIYLFIYSEINLKFNYIAQDNL